MGLVPMEVTEETAISNILMFLDQILLNGDTKEETQTITVRNIFHKKTTHLRPSLSGTMDMRDTENIILIITMLDQSMSQLHMPLHHQHTPLHRILHADQPHKMI